MKSLNPVGAALTLRATILLPVLACLAARRLTAFRLTHAAWVLAVLTIVNCALGIAQNQLPPTHALNRYAVRDSQITAVDSGVRATGTFSYITGMAVISSVGIWSGTVLLSLARNRFWQIGGAAAVLAGFGCGLASVSRSPILIGGVMLLVWILAGGRRSTVFRSPAVLCGFAILLAGVGLLPTLKELGTGVLERHETGGDSFQGRAFGQMRLALEATSAAPLGNGLGTEQVAGNYAATGTLSFTTYEEQLPRLVLEVGVLGVVGFLVICAGALLALESASRATHDPPRRALYRVTQVLLGLFFYTNVVFNHTSSAFAWMIFAAVLGVSGSQVLPPNRSHGASSTGQRDPRRSGAAA